MKNFTFRVNGYEVEAKYDQFDIEKVYKPLLERWHQIYKEKNQRIFISLAACPGSGKSTFASFLEYLFSTLDYDCKLQAIGMDGFHYNNDYLEKNHLIDEKGSQNTFDVKKLEEKIEQTRKESCFWPEYSRQIHNPIENKIYVDGDIILIEGNYLLCDQLPWSQLQKLWDDCVFLYVDKEELKPRLIQRKMKGNYSFKQALDFYEQSDSKNIDYVLQHKVKANVEIYLKENKVD